MEMDLENPRVVSSAARKLYSRLRPIHLLFEPGQASESVLILVNTLVDGSLWGSAGQVAERATLTGSRTSVSHAALSFVSLTSSICA